MSDQIPSLAHRIPRSDSLMPKPPSPDPRRSGTLSYIFNTMKPGDRFSEVVWSAKRRGYTEPDAREDLSGGWTGVVWAAECQLQKAGMLSVGGAWACMVLLIVAATCGH